MRFCKTHFLFSRTNNRFTGCGEPERTRLCRSGSPAGPVASKKKRAATLLGSGPCIRKRIRWLEQLFDRGFDVGKVVGRLEACNQVAVAVDEELGEVPSDVGLVAELGVVCVGVLL